MFFQWIFYSDPLFARVNTSYETYALSFSKFSLNIEYKYYNSQSASGNDILYFSAFFPFTWLSDSVVVRPVNLATPLALMMLKAGVGNGFLSKTLRSSSPDLPLTAGSFVTAPPPRYTPPNPLVLILLFMGYRGDPFQGLSTSSGSGCWVGDLLPGSDFEVRLNP